VQEAGWSLLAYAGGGKSGPRRAGNGAKAPAGNCRCQSLKRRRMVAESTASKSNSDEFLPKSQDMEESETGNPTRGNPRNRRLSWLGNHRLWRESGVKLDIR